MKTEPTFLETLRYKFDNTLSRGSIALIGWLGLISLVIISIAGVVLSVGRITQPGDEPMSFWEGAWESLMRTLDAGTMGGDQGWGFRIVMAVVTIGGIFIISTLIGILTSSLEQKIEELQKGRSRVIEKNHTVILGWSEQIFSIISELMEANSNQKDACIVIMGDHDKMEMQDAVRERIPETRTTRIVCRTGSPIEISDLAITSLNSAKSIIVLSSEGDDPDAEVIKTILAITNNPERREEPYHIVAEMRDPRNLEVARMVGKDEVEFVLVSSLIARIIAQTCRQSGLSTFYTELLDFGGDEIYMKEEPALVGKSLREALFAYEDSAVMGLKKKDQKPALNPPMDTLIEAGDEIIVISEDDDTVRLSGKTSLPLDVKSIVEKSAQAARPERTLVLGWNWRGANILEELDRYVPSGSDVLVVAKDPQAEGALSDLSDRMQNQKVIFQAGETTDRRTLDSLNIPSFDHIILLCYSDLLSPQQADSQTLVTLLHLRDMAEKAGKDFSIVSEMLDIRNRNLAEVTQADDFIVSDKLISLMLAQVSENKYLNAVFEDVFDPEGSEIYLKSAANYVIPGVSVSFYTVIEAAARKGEVAIGYKQQQYAKNPEKAYGVVVNPDKSEQITFSEHDMIVVIAED
jgi:voltage-gated potassium channel Kch